MVSATWVPSSRYLGQSHFSLSYTFLEITHYLSILALWVDAKMARVAVTKYLNRPEPIFELARTLFIGMTWIFPCGEDHIHAPYIRGSD